MRGHRSLIGNERFIDRKQVLTTGSSRCGDHTDLSLREEADRLAIIEVVDAYAYCADRRDAASQMALFTEDTDFLVYLETRNPVPTQHLRRRDALPPVFDELKYLRSYQALQRSKHHSAGWRQRFWVDLLPGTPWQGRRVGADPDGRRNPLPRHFVKRDGGWLFSQRKFMVDWTETRSLVTG